MIYSFRFCNQIDMDKADEVILRFSNKQRNSLIDYLRAKGNDQKLVILIEDEYDDTFFATLYEKYPIFTIALAYKSPLPKITVPFFFTNYVVDWETLHGYANLGVSQVYVAEEICFELRKVAEFCHQRNIKVRIYPNVKQSKFANTPHQWCFYCRPEDMPLIEDIVDVVEFWGDDNKQAIYAEAYKRGIWVGDLKGLIIGLHTSLDNTKIPNKWTFYRMTCGRRCIRDNGCHVCEEVLREAQREI